MKLVDDLAYELARLGVALDELRAALHVKRPYSLVYLRGCVGALCQRIDTAKELFAALIASTPSLQTDTTSERSDLKTTPSPISHQEEATWENPPDSARP